MNINRKDMLLMALFPNADKGFRKKLRNFADEKGIDWLGKDISCALHNLMGSILRHNGTHYEKCIGAVGQERARFYTQGEVTSIIRHFKGV